jgi:hypothetical protein
VSVASGVRAVYDWLASLGPVVLVPITLALIGLVGALIRDSRKRSHQNAVARQKRVAPKMRQLIQIAQEMQGSSSRLTHDPANEVSPQSQRFATCNSASTTSSNRACSISKGVQRHSVGVFTSGPAAIYVRISDDPDLQRLREAGFLSCGAASQGWAAASLPSLKGGSHRLLKPSRGFVQRQVR